MIVCGKVCAINSAYVYGKVIRSNQFLLSLPWNHNLSRFPCVWVTHAYIQYMYKYRCMYKIINSTQVLISLECQCNNPQYIAVFYLYSSSVRILELQLCENTCVY